MSLTDERVQLVIDEVRLLRLEPTRQAITVYVRKAFNLPLKERTRIIDKAVEIVGNAKRQPERRQVTQPKTLGGKELERVAAEVFREYPKWTGRQVYQYLLRQGHKLSVSETSFVNGTASAARKRAGVSGRASAAAAGPSEPDPFEETPPTSEPVADSGPSDEVEEPATTELPATVPARVGVGEPGDHIHLKLGGQELDASYGEDGWDVAFRGKVDGDAVRGVLGHVLTGVLG